VPLVDKNIRLEEIEIKDYLATATFREGRKVNRNGIPYF